MKQQPLFRRDTCAACGKATTFLDFQRATKKGYPTFSECCNDCIGIKLKEWKKKSSKAAYDNLKQSEMYEQHRQRLKDSNHRRVYGLSLGGYSRWFQSQNGVCACCGNPETILDHRSGLPRALAVDHNHDTGEVRSLLCQACNVAFGLMDESPDRIKLLLQYAEKTKRS